MDLIVAELPSTRRSAMATTMIPRKVKRAMRPGSFDDFFSFFLIVTGWIALLPWDTAGVVETPLVAATGCLLLGSKGEAGESAGFGAGAGVAVPGLDCCTGACCFAGAGAGAGAGAAAGFAGAGGGVCALAGAGAAAGFEGAVAVPGLDC